MNPHLLTNVHLFFVKQMNEMEGQHGKRHNRSSSTVTCNSFEKLPSLNRIFVEYLHKKRHFHNSNFIIICNKVPKLKFELLKIEKKLFFIT